MRIHRLVKQLIVETCKDVFGETSRVWLFGSRADDTKKGGDIDLYIETDLMHVVEAKIEFIVRIKEVIGDQKIDVVTHKRHNPQPTIGIIAKEEGVELTDGETIFR